MPNPPRHSRRSRSADPPAWSGESDRIDDDSAAAEGAPAGRSAWYALSEDGDSSVRITPGLRIGETSAGALALNDPEPEYHWLEFVLDDDGTPWLRVLDPARALVGEGGSLQTRRPLGAGDVLVLPGNSLRISRTIEAPPTLGRRFEIVERSDDARSATPEPAGPRNVADGPPDEPGNEAAISPTPPTGKRAGGRTSGLTTTASAARMEAAPEAAPATRPDTAPIVVPETTARRPDIDPRVERVARRPADAAAATVVPRSVEQKAREVPPPAPIPDGEDPAARETEADWPADTAAPVAPERAPPSRPRRATNPEMWSPGQARGADRGRRVAPGRRLARIGRTALAAALLLPAALAVLLVSWDRTGRLQAPSTEAPVTADTAPASDTVASADGALPHAPDSASSAEDDSPVAGADGSATAVAPPAQASAAGDSAQGSGVARATPSPQRAEVAATATPQGSAPGSSGSAGEGSSGPRQPPASAAVVPREALTRESPSATPRPGASSAPTRPAAADPRMAADLARARELMEAGFITFPPNSNAVSVLTGLLKQHPRDPAVMDMLGQCTTRLIEAAVQARRQGLEFEARNTLEEVFGFNPDNEQARALWREWTGAPR